MLIWAHGLEGSPHGTKVQALRAAGLDVVAPDCRNLALADRLVILKGVLAEHAARRPVLAGSSYGGLATAWLAAQAPHRLRGLLLCAPALHYREAPIPPEAALRPPPALPVRVIHGLPDAVVPVSGSRAYVEGAGGDVRLVEVDDDHRLASSLADIVALARELEAAPGG